MRARLVAVAFAAASLIPTLAQAQQTCEQRKANRVAGTVVGAGIGAILGSAVAGHGDRGKGAVIGGVGGAVVGNQVAKGSGDCAHAYGYYDDNNNWHSNAVSRADARGYYDSRGNWVEGAPDGRWDEDGRWSTANANGYGYNASYGGVDAPRDVRQRFAWLNERVRRGVDDGSLSRREANRALRDLDSVQREERRLRRRDGRLASQDEAYIQSRLDTISSEIRWSRRN